MSLVKYKSPRFHHGIHECVSTMASTGQASSHTAEDAFCQDQYRKRVVRREPSSRCPDSIVTHCGTYRLT